MTTRAIVLSLRKHSDRAMLLSVYTEAEGRKDVLVYGAQGKRHGIGLYRPMVEIELVTIDTPNRRPALKESTLLRDISDSPERQMTALIMAEVAYVTLREPSPDAEVYHLLSQAASMDVPTYLWRLSTVLGYGGEALEEWQNLTSLAMYRDLIQ